LDKRANLKARKDDIIQTLLATLRKTCCGHFFLPRSSKKARKETLLFSITVLIVSCTIENEEKLKVF